MPPRKRARPSAASTPLGDTQPKSPPASRTKDDLLSDAWADEQETQLFKSMMKWKPTGLHKHFRMISIHNDMRSHGFATEDAPHTRIPGIWTKLNQLYDLDTLDTRENSAAFSDEPDPEDLDEAYDIPDFELPEDEFGQLMWDRRFHDDESTSASSPPMIPTDHDKALFHPGLGLLKDLPGGGVRSHKAETPAEATPTPKTTKTTRASRSAAKNAKTTKSGANTGKNTKAQSTPAVSESAEEKEDEDDEEGSSAESEEESAPSTRRTNRSRQKPAPKRTRKR